MDATRPLTPKEEAFCQAYLVTRSGSEAFRRVYSTGKMSDKAITNGARNVRLRPPVAARIAQLGAEVAQRHEVTMDELVNLAREAVGIAREKKDSAGMIAGVRELGILSGLRVTKREIRAKAEEMSDKDLEEAIRRDLADLGLNPATLAGLALRATPAAGQA
ncbi:MAG: terminase small subunit [Magnetococcales bacterium]|nr:terminase small subunit [Magnetococcales bacterium]